MYVKSFSYNQHQIIKWILQLHCETDIELDPTYSVGGFYKQGIKQPKFKFDIMPRKPGVVKAFAENLPIKDSTINTMIFDPPFLATKGKSLDCPLHSGQNKTVRRFGWYPSEKELFDFYSCSLSEFNRVLRPGGILIFKCQDKVSSGKQYFTHAFIMREAEKIGFYIKDLFVLLAKSRLVADWQLKNQQHARKFHAYFLVLQKSNRKIEYI